MPIKWPQKGELQMKLEAWKNYIAETYSTEIEYPWKRYPDYCVFRHQNNRKWFGLIANIPKATVGIEESGTIDILNLKLDPMLITILRSEKGFFPAYHMNKTLWVSVALDGSVPDERIMDLIDMSFDLTANG